MAPERRVLSPREHAFAGFSGGLVSTAALYPLDLIKTRFQVQQGANVYRGTIDAFRTIARVEGPRSLYNGMVPMLIGASASWGLYFYWYETAKAHRKSKLKEGMTLGAADHLISATQAGTFTCILTNPIWLVKTRMQVQVNHTVGGVKPYTGFVDAVTSIVRQEGFFALYKGLLPALLLVSHGAIQFTAYEKMKSMLMTNPSDSLHPGAYLILGGASKVVASVATYPSQVVRTRLQVRADAPSQALAVKSVAHYKGVTEAVAHMFRNEGVCGFYKGLVPNVLRVAPGSALTFFMYELWCRYL